MSYFTLRTIIVLMETMKDFYSSRTVPPAAAVATRRCDLRVNEYAALDQPSQHYQRSCQTQNCHCDKYHRVGWHVCQKIDHLALQPAVPNAKRRTPQLRASSKEPATTAGHQTFMRLKEFKSEPRSHKPPWWGDVGTVMPTSSEKPNPEEVR